MGKRSDRTLKRELGVGAVICLFALGTFAMSGSDPALVTARAAIIAALALPTFIYTALAFGMQWVSTQTDWGGPSSYSSTLEEMPTPPPPGADGPAMPEPPPQ
ncbi:MAG: hypothetical protein E5W82_10890 [Mesorhizobium sp.]|nr:MAG: hypothetical protein E5W82_10890 [Mesorhizobium sp.]